ncbi:hypothetical protein N0V85_001756 [Neurospora sp. IMI 360204]|nr:hypothetical protein N0V85_001756 [Neurospora sp. IMI 360204]
MSYEHRCLMRRRLELYHDILTEQLRPRIEAAAAATTEHHDSDADQYIDDDTDNTDDTDDSDEDLCEWEHAENKPSEESYARITQWRCGLEVNRVWEKDAPDYCENTEKGSDQVELEQQDDNEAFPITGVHHVEHSGSRSSADTSVQTSHPQSNLINHSLSLPTNSRLSQSNLRSKSLPPLNLLLSHCPPTPPPETSSTSTSTYSQLRFTVTQAELDFFYKHIEQIEYMIRGIDYQFQMQEYRNEVRRQNWRRRRRAEVEEKLMFIAWGNEMPSEDWSNGACMEVDEAELVDETMEDTGHQSRENAAVTGEWDSGGLEGADDPNSHGRGELGDGCGTDGDGQDGESVGAEGAGDEDAVVAEEDGSSENGWDSAWSSTWSEQPEEKTQLHQPPQRSPLRKGYTPDDMVWEEAVAEAKYLSFYGHQFKKDERGRRYWRL